MKTESSLELVWEQLNAHKDRTLATAISPDGKLGLTGGYDGKATLWNLQDGKKKGVADVTPAKVTSLLFTPDKQEFVISGTKGLCEFWNIKTFQKNRAITPFSAGPQYVMQFSPDQKRLYLAGYWEWMRIIDTSTYKEIIKVPVGNTVEREKSKELIHGADLHPSNKFFASGSDTGLLKLWDTETAKEIRSFSQAPKQILSVKFSIDGNFLFCSGVQNMNNINNFDVRMWETETGKLTRRFKSNKRIKTLITTKDSQYLIGTGDTLTIWNISTGEIVLQDNIVCSSATLSSDEKFILMLTAEGHVRYYKFLDLTKLEK